MATFVLLINFNFMKFSKNWLQEYIIEALPSDEVIESVLNKKAFEVEEVIVLPADTVFDIKVLPNRSHDALGHHGMAYELCASLGLTFNKEKDVHLDDTYFDTSIPQVDVVIEDTERCTRFMSLRMDNVTVTESPLWLKTALESIGQRSINNIVDATNFVQFSLNKPMHAYDARSIKGTLAARLAKRGETLVTLDEKTLSLDDTTLVIVDDEKVLGLAGIKGGKYSGIQTDTTSVILESANFAPVPIRTSAQKYGLKTDASKRFENGLANNLVIEGLHMTANLIHQMCPTAKKGHVTDVYPKKDIMYYVGISKKEINDILGTSYSDEDITKTLKKLSFLYEIFSPKDYINSTYKTLLGAGYKNPSSMREDAPHMFSCSSLVSYLYKGVWMPSLSIDKYVFSKKITEEELSFGDLVFANTGEGIIRYESVEFLRGTKVPLGVDHVGIYVGDDTVLHATKVRGMVVEESLSEFREGRTIVGYGRVVDDGAEKRYVVQVPSVRLDIRIKEDLAEEIGRIIGYDTITPMLPVFSRHGILHKRAFYENKLREILVEGGFSEVMTYTFGNIGDVELRKGLADDKEKLRTSLAPGMLASLTLNLYNAPLLGKKTIKIFEIGNVFQCDSLLDHEITHVEKRHLSVAFTVSDKNSYEKELQSFRGLEKEIHKKFNLVPEAEKLSQEMYGESVDVPHVSVSGDKNSRNYIIEYDIEAFISNLPEPTSYEAPSFASSSLVSYKTISSYPFIARDIAMWVPGDVSWESISDLCDQVRSPLATSAVLFDTFSKEIEGIKKTSYAFRVVFQSHEKTLTDEEVNTHMEAYYSLFKERGFEIR
jgi:phenylalanyl-tRNA synthetase beta subunit